VRCMKRSRSREQRNTTARCTYPLDFDAVPLAGNHHVHWTEIATKDGAEVAYMAHDPLDFTLGKR
jgi:hypothetical protein